MDLGWLGLVDARAIALPAPVSTASRGQRPGLGRTLASGLATHPRPRTLPSQQAGLLDVPGVRANTHTMQERLGSEATR